MTRSFFIPSLLLALVLVLPLLAGNIRVDGQIQSTVDQGAAPFFVTSQTRVDNLNVDMLDGLHGSDLYTRDALATGGEALVHWDNLVGAPPLTASAQWLAPFWSDSSGAHLTYVAVHNPGSGSTSVTVTFRAMDGSSLASDTQLLAADETRLWASESGPGGLGGATGTGSVRIESTVEEVLPWGSIVPFGSVDGTPLRFYPR